MQALIVACGFGRSKTSIGCLYLYNNIADSSFLGETDIRRYPLDRDIIIDSSKIYLKNFCLVLKRILHSKRRVYLLFFYRNPVLVFNSYKAAKKRRDSYNNYILPKFIFSYSSSIICSSILAIFFKTKFIRADTIRQDLDHFLYEEFKVAHTSNKFRGNLESVKANRAVKRLTVGTEIIK